ncbi:MAG: DUF2807 domain-containing protein [Prevotellaceae bacterium]|jgi:hypothetical protein|nr:DUF2807 domain-containing protein [Prevotellaceae bacterium]
MKRFLYTVICVILLASCSDEIDLAGTNVPWVESPRENFSGISVQDGFELSLFSGDTSKIEIESDRNVLDHVNCEIKNGILCFYKEPKTVFPSKVVVKIQVTTNSLDALIILSSKVQIVDTLKTNEISIFCSDKSILTGRLECNRLQSVINNSTVELTGVSGATQANIDNGSLVKLFGMESNNAKVNISGGSLTQVTVFDEFEISAKERSILHYKGTAVIRDLVSDDDSEIKKVE